MLKLLKNFLNKRKWRAVINGKSSKWSDVLSGMSIIVHNFIKKKNDLPGMVGSVCKLFADDHKLYRNIESEADLKELQEDIERLCKLSRDWLLGLNIKKCKVI